MFNAKQSLHCKKRIMMRYTTLESSMPWLSAETCVRGRIDVSTDKTTIGSVIP